MSRILEGRILEGIGQGKLIERVRNRMETFRNRIRNRVEKFRSRFRR